MQLRCFVVLGALCSLVFGANDFTFENVAYHTGDTLEITWDNLQGDVVTLALTSGTSSNPVASIAANISNVGSYNWHIPDTIPQDLNYAVALAIGTQPTSSVSGSFAILSSLGTNSASATSQGATAISASPSATPAASASGQPAAPAGSTATVTAAVAAAVAASPGLTAGAIAGIVVGVVGALALGAGAALLILRCRRTSGSRGAGSGSGWGPQHHQQQQWQQQQPPPMGFAAPLSPQNLDQHLAGQEWSGIRRDVPQKQTAYQNVVVESRYGGSMYEGGGNGTGAMSELRPEDAPGESRHGGAMSAVHSEAPLTAMYPASETVWHPKV